MMMLNFTHTFPDTGYDNGVRYAHRPQNFASANSSCGFPPGASQWLTSINPTFEILSLDDIVGDELHTTWLGVAKAYAAAVFVMLCLADVYQSGHDSQDCR